MTKCILLISIVERSQWLRHLNRHHHQAWVVQDVTNSRTDTTRYFLSLRNELELYQLSLHRSIISLMLF